MDETPLNIVHVVGGAGRGGMERHVADLSYAQASAGNILSVIAHESILEELRDPVVGVPMDLARSRYRPDTLAALRGAIKRSRATVVHVHGSKAAFMVNAARKLGPSPAKVSVATVHGLKKNSRPYRGYRRVLAVSHAAAERSGIAGTIVVPNGIEPPAGSTDAPPLREVLGLAGTRPVAIAAGRLAPVKGYDLLLRAWAGIDADLVLAGDGPERPALEALADEMGVRDHVRFLGWREDVPALMAGADLMVMSSRREGFPYTLLEALHGGCPVVGTRVGALGELLPEAAIAEPEDAESLRAALAGAVADLPALRAAFGPLFARAAEEFTLARMAERTLAIYREALSEATASRAARERSRA